MAKIVIKNSCGHGSSKVVVSGNNASDQKDKLEKTQLCRDCFIKKKIADDNNQPKLIHLKAIWNIRVLEVEVAVTGRISESEQVLKELGFNWHYRLDEKTNHRKKEKWLSKNFKFECPAHLEQVMQSCSEQLLSLGYKWQTDLSTTLSSASKTLKENLETIQIKDSILNDYLGGDLPPDEPLQTYMEIRMYFDKKGWWNGKVYGWEEHYIYINEEKLNLPDEFAEKIREYRKELYSWQLRHQNIKHLLDNKHLHYSISELQQQISLEKRKDEFRQELYKNSPPPSDQCFDFMRKLHIEEFEKWNGIIYGVKRKPCYYLNNKQYLMTKDQRAEIEDYQKRLKSWKKENSEALRQLESMY